MYRSKFCCGRVCVALLLIHSASQAQLSFNVTTVATPGEAVPVPSELVAAYGPTLNDSGQVAFMGDGALLLGSNGVTTIAAAFGDPAPGGCTFIYGGGPLLNSSGQIAFWALLAGPNRSGILLWSKGGLQIVAQDGDPAPGGGVFSYFANVSINDAGQVAFTGYAYPPSRQGIFLWSDGNTVSIAQTGDPAPGGGTFYIPGPTFPRRYVPLLNAMGQIVFGARLSSPTGNSAVFLYSADGLRRIAGPGDPAPGGGTFVRARSASLNDLGEVALAGSLNPSGSGVYLVSQGTMNKVVATGDPAPSGGTFWELDATKINSHSQVAFEGSTDQFSTSAIYLATPAR